MEILLCERRRSDMMLFSFWLTVFWLTLMLSLCCHSNLHFYRVHIKKSEGGFHSLLSKFWAHQNVFTNRKYASTFKLEYWSPNCDIYLREKATCNKAFFSPYLLDTQKIQICILTNGQRRFCTTAQRNQVSLNIGAFFLTKVLAH